MRKLVNRLYKDDVQDGLQDCLDAGMEISRHVQKIRSRGSGASILKCISFMKDYPVDNVLLTCLGPFTRRASCKDVDSTGLAPFAPIRHDGSTCGKVMEKAYLLILVFK